jgi:hypothetical protein
MTAIISTTYDSKYLYFLPIVTWCWNKLGVDVICFVPIEKTGSDYDKISLAMEYCNNYKLSVYQFEAPEHKESTYAQCSRLYVACLDLPENEILITGDIDMAMFKVPEYTSGAFNIFGSDLTPPKQFPICYLMATVKEWRDAFDLNGKSYQECLDGLLGSIEAESFRGNYWCKDQEEAYNKISKVSRIEKVRAKEGTQFSTKRYDRDDAYILDRLSLDTIDFHLLRPGFEESNFNIIMRILEFHYPNDNLQWIINYRNEYLKIL